MGSNRRNFIKKATVGAFGLALTGGIQSVSAKSYSRIIGANDRIQVAIQGLGRRYGAFLEGITNKKNNIELVYLCDVRDSIMNKAAEKVAKLTHDSFKLKKDIRKIIADKNVDAVFMSTPDHWHAPGACMALQGDKHVYLEKPCSHNPKENELLLDYQKKYNKLVQMGNQQRSSLVSQEIIKEIHNGIIGEAYQAIAFYVNNRGEVPKAVKGTPPTDLDWNLFQGPAPRKDYIEGLWDYNWHWYGWDYGTAETGNNATHELDIARWALQVKFPEHVSVNSGKYQFVDDGWEMYDTMDATFKFSGNKMIQWDGRSRNGHAKFGKDLDRGTIIYGTEGSVFVDRGGYKLYDRKGDLIKEVSENGPSEEGTALGGGGGMTTKHTVNFFDAIRGKSELTSPIQIGAISQMLVHYANISSRIGKSFDVNEQNGQIFDKDAMKLWSREYEPGWEIKPV